MEMDKKGKEMTIRLTKKKFFDLFAKLTAMHCNQLYLQIKKPRSNERRVNQKLRFSDNSIDETFSRKQK